MRLLLMRHGKSDWASGSMDHDRPLNERGRNAASAMGRILDAIGEVPDRVVSSSAERAASTAGLVVAAGGWQVPVVVEPDLYLPPPAVVHRVVAAQRDVGRLLVVGHEPTWSRVVAELTGARVAMRTATVAVVEDGCLEALLQPRHVARLVTGG